MHVPGFTDLEDNL